MATTIAELLVKMGVSVEGAKAAEAELDGVKESAENIDKEGGAGVRNFGATAAKAFAAAGATAVAAAVGIFKLVDSVTSANDEIVKGARVAGLGTDEYQRLGFAAKISGTNIKAVSIASKTVARGLNDAATKGTGPFVEGLELVGLRLEDVADIPFEQQLGVFADAIGRLDSESEKLAASQLLLGARAGPQLATLLAEGSDGIKRLGDEAAATGGVIGGPALEQAAEFQDSITRLKTVFGGFASELATDLAPIVQEVIDNFKDWTLANGDLIAKDIKGFIRAVIPVIKGLASAVGFIVDGIKGFIDIMGGLKSAMGLAATAAVGFKLAMAGALGPIGAIGLAISGLVSIIGGLVNQFEEVNDQLEESQQRAFKLRRFQRRGEFKDAGRAEAAFTARERISSAEAVLQDPDALPETKAAARTVINSAESTLSTLKALEDAARIREEHTARVEGDAQKRSKAASRSFAERQRAGGRVREQLGEGRRADTLVNQVIQGRITEEEALGGGAKGRKRGGGRRATAPEKEPESSVTLAEALLAVRTGTADPRQLKQVIQQLARKTPSTKAIKPTVAIDFFNFVITQNIKGASPREIAKQSATAIRGEFEKQTARAGQAIPGSVVR